MGRAVGVAPKQRYHDYTAERLKAEGKPLPAILQVPEQHTGGAAAAGTLGGGEIYDRLVQRFGLGDNPMKRMALYRRIKRLVESQPTIAVYVYEAAEKASAADQPDRYFCAAVCRLLRGAMEVFKL